MFNLSLTQIATIVVLAVATNAHIGSYNKPQLSLANQMNILRVATEGENQGKRILYSIPDANPMSYEKFVFRCEYQGGFGAWNLNDGKSEKTCFAKAK
jgi:hypothetical protein